MRRVAGIDPSLTSTGFSVITRTVSGRTFLTAHTFRVPATGAGAVAESQRVAEIVDQVCQSSGSCERVYIEALAFASRTGKYAERAHLLFSLVAAYHARRMTVDVIPPTTLKKTVTGSGRADKDAVLGAVRDAWTGRGWEDGQKTGRYDRADASALAWMAARDAGFPDLPTL